MAAHSSDVRFTPKSGPSLDRIVGENNIGICLACR
jgi:hypothetical protein